MHFLRMALDANLIILGYGADPIRVARAERVRELLSGRQLFCLGRTKNGAPRHPLYLRSDAELVEFDGVTQ